MKTIIGNKAISISDEYIRTSENEDKFVKEISGAFSNIKFNKKQFEGVLRKIHREFHPAKEEKEIERNSD